MNDKRFKKAHVLSPSLESSLLALGAAIQTPASSTPWLSFDSLFRFLTILFLMIGLASTLLTTSFDGNKETEKVFIRIKMFYC